MEAQDIRSAQQDIEEEAMEEKCDYIQKCHNTGASSKQQTLPGYGFKEDLSLVTKFKVPLLGELYFNPLVTMCSIVLIWGFVAWACIMGDDFPFIYWKREIVEKFTWLYIASPNCWAIFVIVLYCSKYGNLKLGKPDDKPEFNDSSWFMMLFACGIGVGLFFYGVAEPIFHYTSRNRYYADSTLPDNELAQLSINLTIYHWGVHAWIVYSLVGLALGLISYREGLPMTMKSCFYPLIGDKIFGWIGDVIDILSVMSTLFGVCTSLGLGTRQLNAGLTLLNSDIPEDNLTIQVIIIWCITAVATTSTISGVGMGIRRLSELCFVVGMFIMTVCLFTDNTYYILNLFVQSIGYYLQHIIQLGWHTDAFEQLGSSYGGVDRNRFVPKEFNRPDGPTNWMDSWTVFYWGWWISWSPFVGMFIAKISKGRTIRQFINGTLTAPVVYTLMWMVLFGGIGIKIERDAAEVGLCCNNAADRSTGSWFQKYEDLKDNAGQSLDAVVTLPDNNISWMCQDQECSDCAMSVISMYSKSNYTYGQLIKDYEHLKGDFGSTSGNRRRVRLSCHATEQMWFDVMRTYPGIGSFLAMFSLLALILYFVTSSDSGSLIIDSLSANGHPDPPWFQRAFWSITEGATATALLAAGGKQGLSALQTAGIVSGLPYTFITYLLCISIWQAVQVAHGDQDPSQPSFQIGLFDPFFTEPFKRLKLRPTLHLLLNVLVNIFIAPITVAKVGAKVYGKSPEERCKWWKYAVISVSLFSLFVIFHLMGLALDGMWAIGWFFYLTYTCFVTGIRTEMRQVMNIDGNVYKDFLVSLFFYPTVAVQLEQTAGIMVEEDKFAKGDSKHNSKLQATSVTPQAHINSGYKSEN